MSSVIWTPEWQARIATGTPIPLKDITSWPFTNAEIAEIGLRLRPYGYKFDVAKLEWRKA